jgi:glycosyltransferase involved in cell wall biosynthesis
MNKRKLVSIVIPMYYDKNIENTVKNINSRYRIEIVIVLNGQNKEAKKIINNLKRTSKFEIKVFNIKERNIGMAREVGCLKSSGEYLVMLDSDILLRKSAIDKLIKDLRRSDLSKGNLIYRYSNQFNKIVAESRYIHSSGIKNAYTPLLAFRKEIAKKIGYYFNKKIPWTEDYEFDQRIKKMHLKLVGDALAIGYHQPVSMSHDLHNSFNYGYGFSLALLNKLISGDSLYGKGNARLSIIKSDILRWINVFKNTMNYKNVNISVKLYLIIWNVFFSLGKFYGCLMTQN